MLTMVKEKLRRTPVGLDIGESGVRAAQIKQTARQAGFTGQRFVVAKVIKHEWRSTEPEKDVAEEETKRQTRVARFVRSANIRKQSVVVELNPPDVECYPLDLPAAAVDTEESKLAELVRWEVERLLGDAHESVETRHRALPRTNVPSPTVMAAVAQTDAVVSLVDLCDASGVHCLAVEPASVALARFGSVLSDWNTDEVWAVLDLGATETRLVLCVEGVPTVVRRVGAGGRAWTTQVAESLKVGLRAAEIQKCEQGIAFSRCADSSKPIPARDVASILLGALRNELRCVVSEIERSYEYALSCYPQRRAGGLCLVGGGAAMRNLPEFLGDALSIPVARASDYLNRECCRVTFDAGNPEEMDEFAVAIGLALPPGKPTCKQALPVSPVVRTL